VYPALSVLKQLMSQKPEPVQESQVPADGSPAEELQVLWVGGDGGMEADLVKREGIRFEAIPAAGVHGVGLRALPGNLWQLSRGFFFSRRILRKFQPDVLFYTGGYVAVPMALAARLFSHSRSVLYIPDIEPGQAIKTIARFSDTLALTVTESGDFFPKHPSKVVTGYPLRPGIDRWTVDNARSFFALPEQMPVLMVFGGSRGAHSINLALVSALSELLEEMQVIHISGKLDWPMIEQVRSKLSKEQLNRYRPFPYLYDEIGAAMRLADLAVTRAGASILGELPVFGLPAIVVPYPHAWRYQRVNASYLVRREAAELLDDALLGDQLVVRIRALMADDTRRQRMSHAMRGIAEPSASARIAGLLSELGMARKNKTFNHVPDRPD
jgi:UDP-N-acetylglucosamine:LPS N-acetylglucosamine transferase